MAEFERGLISERTKAGIAASAAQGQKMGRPPSLDKMQIEYALERHQKGEAVTAIARSLRIHRSTLYEYLNLKNYKYKGQILYIRNGVRLA